MPLSADSDRLTHLQELQRLAALFIWVVGAAPVPLRKREAVELVVGRGQVSTKEAKAGLDYAQTAELIYLDPETRTLSVVDL